MSHSVEIDPKLLQELSRETPFFLFSRQRLLDKYNEFTRLFPGALIHYALKANSEREVLQLLAEAGSGFEVASMYELKILQELSISPKQIIYGTSVKPTRHISAFHDHGVDRFAFDSLPELEKLAALVPGAKVYVRVSVNDTGSVFRFSEKFGTSVENVVPLLQHAKERDLHPYGISFHVGSQASNPLAWANALKSLSEPLAQLREAGITLDILNIGGGYPCTYGSTEHELTLEEIAQNTLAQYEQLPYQPQLLLEPGRGIVASTAILVASVIGRVERTGNTWLFLDTGVYDSLYEAMAFQGSTRYKITSVRHSYDSGEMLYALAGPTGDSQDIITREALLPQDIEVGDKLLIHDVGAYSLVVSSPFNGFPKPAVHFVDHFN